MRIFSQQFHDSVAGTVAAWTASRKPRVRGASPVPASEAGLTLVEMIVVLAIIAIVAALIVPNVISRPDQARVTTANTDIQSIGAALKMYRLDNGDYPTTQQGLKALVERPTTPPVPGGWAEGGYLSQMPVDPWGNPYAYTGGSGSFELKSLGKDGRPGGEGLDADIDGKRR
ncbi:type II secretion system major pseudopilin GspG [Sphingomonas sp. ac-8]|uniref:type II secretion system major pseudopilin GspG n=1 Tax=Sphingomonas sp. ac-8 TaxID=3242977 RepID=UPI003A8025E3